MFLLLVEIKTPTALNDRRINIRLAEIINSEGKDLISTAAPIKTNSSISEKTQIFSYLMTNLLANISYLANIVTPKDKVARSPEKGINSSFSMVSKNNPVLRINNTLEVSLK
jgi:hypothetical protein